MGDWKKYSIQELCEKVYSGGTPSTKKQEYYDGNIPWLNTSEIDFRSIFRTEKFISEDGLKNSSAKWVPENSVVIAMYGNTAGKSAINKIPLTTNQACCNLIVDPKKADYRFIYYRVLNDYKLIKDLSVGGAQQNLNAGTIKAYEIIAPPLPEQRAIASILSALDNKIELNLQMNKTLEEMAMTLYKHWFVDFGPFKDGEFVSSELGEIPKGWEIKNIYQMADVIYGAPFKSKQFNETGEGYPLIRIRDLKTCLPQFYTNENHPKKTVIKPGDILAGMDAEFSPSVWLGEEAVLNQRVVLFKPVNNIGKRHVLEAIKPWLKYFERAKVGTTVIHLGKQDIDTFRFSYPINDSILRKYMSELEGYHEKIVQNGLENRTLTQLREFLLPKLISGEIRVKEATKTLEKIL